MSDNVNVNGVGGSGGAEGGDISIEGASVELDGDWTAVGNSGARGGSVDVTATTGTIVTVSGSSIDVSGGGTGGGLGGTVRFDAPGDITVAGAHHEHRGRHDERGRRDRDLVGRHPCRQRGAGSPLDDVERLAGRIDHRPRRLHRHDRGTPQDAQ